MRRFLTIRRLLTVVLIAVCAYLLLVWPTLWEYRGGHIGHDDWRRNRITHSVDVFNYQTGRWERARYPKMYGTEL